MVGLAASIPEQFNVAQYFVDRSLDEGRGDFVAVFYREHRLTYRRIWELANRAANALERGGVQRLDRVLLLLHDSPAFAAAFLGAIKLGAAPVPASTLLLPEDYEFMLRDSGARTLVVERGLLQKLRPVLPKLSGGQVLLNKRPQAEIRPPLLPPVLGSLLLAYRCTGREVASEISRT